MIKKQLPEEQIATMQRLINFGKIIDESKSSTPIVEYKKKAANGKTYGIIRESTKFYIMEAPKKDTEVLAEDFDYIGGFNNRKENEYNSYAKASNALDLKLMSINETVNKQDRVQIEIARPKSEWETQITEGMRKEIDRFKDITEHVNEILTEDKGNRNIPSEHTLPEAPSKNPSVEKVNSPYIDTAVANGDKDFKQEEHDHVKAGKPFSNDGRVSDEDMKSDKNVDDSVYSEKAKYTPKNSVSDEHPKGGKVVRVNEHNGHKIRLKLTEEQVLAWNDNKDYTDKTTDTKVGSSAPYGEELGDESNQTETIHEISTAVHNTDDQNEPTPGTNKVGDGSPYDNKVNEDTVTAADAAGMPNEDDFSDYPFPDVAAEDNANYDDEETSDDDVYQDTKDEDEYEIDLEDDLENGGNAAPKTDIMKGLQSKYGKNGMKGLENWQDDWNKFDDDDDYGFYESKKQRGRKVNENKLEDFGKHPAYDKEPMTTPPNKEVAINGAKEWDDESVQGEESFGRQIGNGSPYSEIVDSMTESIMKTLLKKKV